MLAKNIHGVKSNFLSHVLEDRQTGTVHSIFTNSFNLLFKGQLVHVGKESEGVSAFGITLPNELVDEALAIIEVDNRVIWQEGEFSVYTRKKVIKIDTNPLIESDCSVPELRMIPDWVLPKMRQLPFKEKIEICNTEKNRAFIDMFIDSSLSDSNFQVAFINRFIGRGQGLTPSGDDMLMGILLGEKAFGCCSNWSTILEEKLHERKTTAISYAYYEALLNGYTSSHFVNFLNAIKWNQPENWDTLIENISKYGHTSGWDTLFGLFLYFENRIGDKIS